MPDATPAQPPPLSHPLAMDTDKIKKYLPLAAAGVLGVGAAGMGWMLVQRPVPGQAGGNGANQQPAVPMAQMVVATQAVSAGDEINPDDLKVVYVPVDVLPPSAFGSIASLLQADAFSASDADGKQGPRVAASPIAAGQPIMTEHLAPAGAEGGLAALLQSGKRAMTVNVDAYSGLRGFLLPDSRVDIVSTLRGDGPPIARTIVQDVRVLAVDGTLAGRAKVEATDGEKLNEEGPKSSVTLLVTPEQAARIELAYANGAPRMVLRAAGDRTLSRFEGLTLTELTGRKKDEAAPRDPWAGDDEDAVDPFAPGGQIASIGGNAPIEAPGPVGAIGDATPIEATAPNSPATRPAGPPRPAPHVVEVIRGGVSDRATVPDRPSQKPAEPAQQGDTPATASDE